MINPPESSTVRGAVSGPISCAFTFRDHNHQLNPGNHSTLSSFSKCEGTCQYLTLQPCTPTTTESPTRVNTAQVCHTIKHAATAARAGPVGYSSRSLRPGGATHLYRVGDDSLMI
ncbi:hypothetical protein PybrP1_012874 [[Pythium] brassicae (nom. inval.)]|nr:hypothetical protein PybrP1_012874 [[Pythium] brassicae (nom. inval.)]